MSINCSIFNCEYILQFITYLLFYEIFFPGNMPKIKPSKSSIIMKYVNEFNNVFKSDGRILYCKVCNKSVSHERKFLVEQHLKSQKHKELLERVTEKSSQSLLKHIETTNKFCMDLCEAFISADIPLNKLSNENLRNFFKTYINESILCQSTLRKNYVDKIYDSELEKICSFLKSKYLWVSMDETTDISELENEYYPNELASFKYAPITSVDVERSFSMYKSFLRPNRQSFTFDNIKKYLFVYTNKNLN